MTLVCEFVSDKETAIETAISDLFFNMDHAEYRRLIEDTKNPPSPSDLQEAIENDAEQMQFWLNILGHDVTAEQLVIDFYERL